MENIDDYRAAARKIRERGVRNVIITLGEEGIFYMSETYDEFLLPSYRNEVVDVTGAGDAFASGYMCGMVQGEDAKTACQLGLAASSLTVQTNRSVSQKLHADLIYSMVSSN
jgi:pseudouridine kinase